MKKLIVFFLSLACILNMVGCSSYIKDEEVLIPSETVENNNRDNSEITEEVIRILQNELAFEDKDLLTFYNDTFESIDIKSTETAEMLFHCIRNCRSITDLTGIPLEPENFPILINGKEIGGFYHIYSEYPETGQFFSFNFTEEDSTALYEYVMALAATN